MRLRGDEFFRSERRNPRATRDAHIVSGRTRLARMRLNELVLTETSIRFEA